jgi:hypothetical protein
MGIDYKLYHHDTKTFIRLGKIFRDEPQFEGYGHEAAWFLATRRIGDFEMRCDMVEGLEHKEEGWEEVVAPKPARLERDVPPRLVHGAGHLHEG